MNTNLISQTRKSRNLSLRAFASALSKPLAEFGLSISHQAVANWENGTNQPSRHTMILLVRACKPDDWRHQFAQQVLESQGHRCPCELSSLLEGQDEK